jgi:Rhamnan synthesis protein F
MKRPENWKIRRELYRIKEQFTFSLFSDPIERARQFRYERSLERRLKVIETGLPLGERIAVFVVFQPKGLLASTLIAFDHLRTEGWAVVVVSNAGLSTADLSAMSERAAAILIRPNFGYDFGGYREGLRFLDSKCLTPERLILMNDSTWFPLREHDDTLRRMEAEGADLAGHIYKVERSDDRAHDHLEAHLLMVGPRFLASSAFVSFWRNYKLSDSKAATIERGEKGLTQLALAQGMVVKGLISMERMLALISDLSDAELKATIEHVVHHRDESKAFCDAVLEEARAGRPWRRAFLTWVLSELSNSRQHLISATFVESAMKFGGMGFVKKANEPRFQLARLAVLRALDQGIIPPFHPVVRQEIQQAVND